MLYLNKLKINNIMKKYLIKAVVPATVVRTFEVEATDKESAMSNYLKGEAFELHETYISHEKDVEFTVTEDQN